MQRVFANIDALNIFLKNLTEVTCPCCHARGFLVRHGFIKGWISTALFGIRGWRVFCDPDSPRGNGCGHAPSIRLANTLRYRWFDSPKLAEFLKSLRAGLSIRAAWKCSTIPLHLSAAYRLFHRLQLCQSIQRPLLSNRAPPPPTNPAISVLWETIDHLHATFLGADPISAFQICFQTDFLSLV
jgi:hypothetical protein